MSGGSYNYVSSACDLGDAWSKRADVQEITEALALLGYAKDAAVESESLLLILRQTDVRVDAALKRLIPVWHALEWWHSGDSNERDLKRAIAEYRGDVLSDCRCCHGTGVESDTKNAMCQDPHCSKGKNVESVR